MIITYPKARYVTNDTDVGANGCYCCVVLMMMK